MDRRSFLKSAAASSIAGVLAPGFLYANNNIKRPNILFAISDDQSWKHAGAYGCPFVNTPAFDRVAKNGVLFNNVFAAAPQCSPNRSAILTGRHIWQLEEAGTHNSNFPRKFKVFTDELEKAGYQCGVTGKPWGPGNYEITGWPRNPAGPELNEHFYDERPLGGISKYNYAENFKTFLNQKSDDKPFFFWFGAFEPHRSYQKSSGLAAGKSPEQVTPPAFLPDHNVIRNDLLDYAVEIEWFDSHLDKMLKLLEERGELQNTLVVVTSDNGMPFPRAKANLYEYGTHMPFAVQWPERIKGGRVVDDLISFIDIAPTFLDVAHAPAPNMVTGKSFLNILCSEKERLVDPSRSRVFFGRERHTHARPDNLGYPSRAIRTADYLYIENMKPDRWPAGNPTGSGEPEGYHDIDACPSKTFLIDHQREYPKLASLSLDKRPKEELFDIKKDPACTENLAEHPDFLDIKLELKKTLHATLATQGDPRMHGNGDIFESYPRYSHMRDFPGFKKRGQYNPEYY